MPSTWFFAKLNSDITPTLKLEDPQSCSTTTRTTCGSALDPTLSPTDIANKKGLQIRSPRRQAAVHSGDVPGYTKLNVYKIYGDILHLDQQDLSFGTIKAGIWLQTADTGPRALLRLRRDAQREQPGTTRSSTTASPCWPACTAVHDEIPAEFRLASSTSPSSTSNGR